MRRKRRGRIASAVLSVQVAAWVGRGVWRMRHGNAPWHPVRHGLRRHVFDDGSTVTSHLLEAS